MEFIVLKMKKLLLLIFMFVFFTYGVVVGVYKVFPYNIIVDVKNSLKSNEVQANTHHKYRLEQFRLFPSEAKNVMVGDSITHVGHWKEIFTQYSILNRGIGADKTTDILDRMDTIFSSSPQRVFLMMGVNDFNIGRREVKEVFDTYKKVITELHSHNVEVVIQSTIECNNCGETTLKVRELNVLLKDYAKGNNIVYLDLNGLLSDDNGLKEIYQHDGVHPNAKGYKAWSSIIEPYLLK